MNTTTDSQSSGARRGCLRWAVIVLGGLAALVVVLTAVVWIAGSRAKAELKAKHPPPGRMVDVGGYKLHIDCQGQGSPTVILEAGSSGFSPHWAYVQPEVAKFTRVCAYDRAGLGWSDPSPEERTSEVIVDELNALLTNAGVEGPYVLVGHSLGGMFVRLYAHEHPDEVAGMVLVDSTHEEEQMRISEASERLEAWRERSRSEIPRQMTVGKLINALGLMALAPENVPGDPDLPPATNETVRALIASDTKFFDTMLEVGANIDQIHQQVRAAQITSFGDMPLVVIARGVPAEADPSLGLTDELVSQYEAIHRQMQTELAELSPNGELVIAEQSPGPRIRNPWLKLRSALRHLTEDPEGSFQFQAANSFDVIKGSPSDSVTRT